MQKGFWLLNLFMPTESKMRQSFCARRKAATHDFEIRHLYEEMEQQIKKEKDKIVLQVKTTSAADETLLNWSYMGYYQGVNQ